MSMNTTNHLPNRNLNKFALISVIVILALVQVACLGTAQTTAPTQAASNTKPLAEANTSQAAAPTATALSPTATQTEPPQATPTTATLALAPTATAPVMTTGVEQPSSLQAAFAAIYQQANPGVVNIQVDITSGIQTGTATGSGWIYDDHGDIVTNNHVVQDGSNVIVTFYSGLEVTAQIIGVDPYSDLAVIQVQSLPPDVHPLNTGSIDQVQVGDIVAAIGSPFGLGSTMTTGIISALGRDIPSLATNYSIPQAIQTDAAINPGNSGGPLLDLNGEVIGVNSQIATGGTNQNSGVGFAIPINIVKMVIPDLIVKGSYAWPYMGISGGSVDIYIQKANNMANQQGAYIDQVTSGGPAELAGLQGSTGTTVVMGAQVPEGGDVIVAVDGQPVTTYDQLLAITGQHKPGDTIAVTVLRDGKQSDFQLTLGVRPSGSQSSSTSSIAP